MLIRSGRAGLIEVVKAVVAFLIVLAPGAYFDLQASGSIFPNTFYAKQSEYGELMSTLPRWLIRSATCSSPHWPAGCYY